MIESIMRGIGEETKDREDELDDALKDLNSLMAKAKETVRSYYIHSFSPSKSIHLHSCFPRSI